MQKRLGQNSELVLSLSQFSHSVATTQLSKPDIGKILDLSPSTFFANPPTNPESACNLHSAHVLGQMLLFSPRLPTYLFRSLSTFIWSFLHEAAVSFQTNSIHEFCIISPASSWATCAQDILIFLSPPSSSTFPHRGEIELKDTCIQNMYTPPPTSLAFHFLSPVGLLGFQSLWVYSSLYREQVILCFSHNWLLIHWRPFPDCSMSGLSREIKP